MQYSFFRLYQLFWPPYSNSKASSWALDGLEPLKRKSCHLYVQRLVLKRRILFLSFSEDRNGTQTTQYITTQGLVSPWPNSLIVQVSSSDVFQKIARPDLGGKQYSEWDCVMFCPDGGENYHNRLLWCHATTVNTIFAFCKILCM